MQAQVKTEGHMVQRIGNPLLGGYFLFMLGGGEGHGFAT